MFSSTPKRSITTLAVFAGLLTAVAPASAQSYPSGNALPTRVACDGIGALKSGSSEVLMETVTLNRGCPAQAGNARGRKTLSVSNHTSGTISVVAQRKPSKLQSTDYEI